MIVSPQNPQLRIMCDVICDVICYVICYAQAVISWLLQLETKLVVVSPIASHPRSVRIQIEELKVSPIPLALSLSLSLTLSLPLSLSLSLSLCLSLCMCVLYLFVCTIPVFSASQFINVLCDN